MKEPENDMDNFLETVEKPVECALSYNYYSCKDSSGEEIQAKALLYKDRLELVSRKTLKIPLLHILRINTGDYRLILSLNDGNTLELFYLGFLYEMFSETLSANRNDELIKVLLMKEKLVETYKQAEYKYYTYNKSLSSAGECSIRLYETAVVIIPKQAEIIRIPLPFISDFELNDYVVTIKTEIGEVFVFTQMGFLFEAFEKGYRKAVKSLDRLISEAAGAFFTCRLSGILRDGRAVCSDAIPADVKTRLEAEFSNLCIKEQLDYLRAQSDSYPYYMGIKKGIVGEMKKPYLWFFIPLGNSDLIAMEAIGEDSSMATYLFDFSFLERSDKFMNKLDMNIRLLNYSLYLINFRREPVYLSEEKLREERYFKYNYAVANIPTLRILRKAFIGRVIHSEKWSSDVSALIKGRMK